MNDLFRLWSHLTPRRRRQLILLQLLILGSSLAELSSLGSILPFLTALAQPDQLLQYRWLQPIAQRLSIDSPSELIPWVTGVFVATVMISNGLQLLTLNVRVRLAFRIGSDLSRAVFRGILYQPYPFHVRHNSSSLIAEITHDVNGVVSSVIQPLLQLNASAVVIAALLTGLLLLTPELTIAAALILGSTYSAVYWLNRQRLLRFSRLKSENSRLVLKILQESLGGIRDVLLDGSQGLFEDLYRRFDYNYRRSQEARMLIAESPRFVITAIAIVSIALMAQILASQERGFAEALPILGGFALGSYRLLSPLQQGFAAIATIRSDAVALSAVLTALDRPLQSSSTAIAPRPLTLERSLRFESVRFRYSDTAPWILDQLDLTIPARSTVAFVGSTGSGKSTTADLILGLLQPVEGTIWIDDRPLQSPEMIRAWQQAIAHVPQSIFLADGTIAENIAFGIPPQRIDRDRVRQAAEWAQIAEFIESLPRGYNEAIGERGVRLSGGQRQRIGIARALYRRASILVLDEATSALDNATENAVMAALQELSRDLTVILIAHRLSTVERCDRVFEFSQGKVIASGTYAELLERSASFQRLAQQDSFSTSS